jgi:hypothetical protein
VYIPIRRWKTSHRKPSKKILKGTKTHNWEKKMSDIKQEMDQVISALENQGIKSNSHVTNEINGLGDLVESTLQSVGITEERFKEWFNLRECNCSKRKAWLNNLFSWKKNNSQG